MNEYATQIERIRHAQSLDEIRAVVDGFPAKATRDGGILYSNWFGDIHSHTIAKELAEQTNLPIVDNTPRGRFLGSEKAEIAIKDSVRRVLITQGQDPSLAKQSAGNFLFGDENAPKQSPISVENSLWGQASREFSGSLRGDVQVIASAANPNRVFGRVEVNAALHESQIDRLAGRPVEELRRVYAQGGANAVLPEVQAQFIEAAPRGIYIASDAIGRRAETITLSKELASTLGVDARNFPSAAELSASGKVVRANIGMSVAVAGDEVALARASTLPDPAVLEMSRPGRLATPEVTPGGSAPEAERAPGLRATGAVTALGAAATIYEGVRTYDRYQLLQEQGNPLAAQSAVNHTLARVIGGWTVGTAGAVLGSGAGPGGTLAGGAAGGVLGERAGERFATRLDNARIYSQTDRDGIEWAFNGRVWKREGLVDATLDSVDNPTDTGIAPSLEKARELNAQASNQAVLLALGDAAKPENPFRLPAGTPDTPSLRPADWRRDPDTGKWNRDVVIEVDRNDRGIYKPEEANPQRAAELDRQSMEMVWRNIATGPAPIAAQYEMAVRRNGYEAFGEAPEAVRSALSPDRLRASDGEIYTRVADGDWARGDTRAQGNLALELETTRGLMQTSVVEHQKHLAAIPPYAARSPEERQREQLVYQYRIAGTELNPDWAEAITLARERTREQHGLSGQGATQLMPGSGGTVGADSDIAHLQVDSQGIPRIQAVTTTEDIRLALDEVRAQQATASIAAPAIRAAPQATALDPGDQAQSIATLQSGLIQLGYHRSISQPLAVNGVNDDATRQAVTAFQAKHDLPITSTFDQATQQALQQALLTQQQATEERQTEDKAREKEQASKEQTRSEELLPYSDPSSPQHARRADLAQRSQVAGVNLTEEQLTLGVAQMQARHINPGWEGGVAVRDGILYVQQFMPPEQFVLDTRQPAPPVQETLQQAAVQQREHAEELARMEAMPKIHGPTLGPGGPGGMPSMQG